MSFDVTLRANRQVLLSSLPWAAQDVPILAQPEIPPAGGWCGPVINVWRSLFTAPDVRLARSTGAYRQHLSVGDLKRASASAYELAGQLWTMRRYATAENLWREGAKQLLQNSAGEGDYPESDLANQLIWDGILTRPQTVWPDHRDFSFVQWQIGSGFQGTAKKLFGMNIVLKSPKNLGDMDPRGGVGMLSAREQKTHRENILGREIQSMLNLKEQGFAIAAIHYVDPDYCYCLKGLIVGPTHSNLESYGLGDDIVALAKEKYAEFLAKKPVIDNMGSNVLFDVDTLEWTVIDA